MAQQPDDNPLDGMDFETVMDHLSKAIGENAIQNSTIQTNNTGGRTPGPAIAVRDSARSRGSAVGGNLYDPFAAGQDYSFKPPPLKCYRHELNEVTFNGLCVTGRCIKCGDAVDIKTLPNSVTALRAKALIEKWLTQRRLGAVASDVDALPEVITEIKMLKAMLELDEDELSLARDRLDIIERDILSTLNEDMVDLQD